MHAYKNETQVYYSTNAYKVVILHWKMQFRDPKIGQHCQGDIFKLINWYFQTLTYLESEISQLAYLKILPNISFGFKLS